MVTFLGVQRPAGAWRTTPEGSRPRRGGLVRRSPPPAATRLGPRRKSRSRLGVIRPYTRGFRGGLRRGRGNLGRRRPHSRSAAGLRPIPLLPPRRSPGLAGGDSPGQFPVGAAPGRQSCGVRDAACWEGGGARSGHAGAQRTAGARGQSARGEGGAGAVSTCLNTAGADGGA